MSASAEHAIKPGRRRFPAPLNAWWNFRRKRFWLVTLLLLYSLAGFVLAPWLVERQLRSFAQDTLGLELQLERLRINPWTLTAEAQSFALLETNAAPLVGFDRLFVNVQTSSLYHRALTLREVTLENPRVNVTVAPDGELNLLGLVPPPAEQEAPPGVVDESSGPFPLLIYDLNILDGAVDLRDETLDTPFTMQLGPVDIELNTLSTLPEFGGEQQIVVVAENGATLELRGAVDLDPLTLSGQLSGTGDFLAFAHRYFQDRLNFDLRESTLELQLNYDVSLDGGLSANVTEIDFALLNLLIEQQSSRLGVQEAISIPAIRISQAAMYWPENRLEIDSIVIEDPTLQIWHDTGTEINLAQLLAGSGATVSASAQSGAAQSTNNQNVSAQSAAPDSGPEFQAAIDRITIDNLNSRIIDHGANDAEINIENLSFQIESIVNDPGAIYPIRLSGGLATGGQFSVEGELGVLPEFTLSTAVSLQALDLSAAQPWLERFANLEIVAGALNLDTQIEVSPEQPFAAQGNTSITGFNLQDSRIQQELTGWENLAVNRFEFNLAQNNLTIDQISATSPYLRFAIAEDGTTNFQDLVIANAVTEEAAQAEQAAAEQSTAADESESFGFTIGQVDIADAAVDFSDRNLPTPFATSISELTGNVSTLSSTSAEPAEIDLSGNVGEFGLVEISGRVLPSAPVETTDLALIFRNVEMSDLTPYTVRFVGREIDSGRISMDLRYRIDQSELEGENEVVIEQLSLGDRVEHPDATSLPLDLAVALLRRPDGTIDINLPVSGDLSNPQFSIGGIVFNAFTGLITRAVAAPFNLLGSLVGAGADEDIGLIVFRPGEDSLTGPEREKMAKLAEALTLRPELNLVLAGSFVPEVDTAALAEQQLDQSIESLLAAPATGDESLSQRRRRALETLAAQSATIDALALLAQYTTTPQADDPQATPTLDEPAYLAELRRQLLAAQEISVDDLDRLARQRATTIRDNLVTEGAVDAARISLLEPVANEADDDGWVPLELDLDS